MNKRRFIVAVGCPDDGYRYYGPFDTESEADNWGDHNLGNESTGDIEADLRTLWRVFELAAPDARPVHLS